MGLPAFALIETASDPHLAAPRGSRRVRIGPHRYLLLLVNTMTTRSRYAPIQLDPKPAEGPAGPARAPRSRFTPPAENPAPQPPMRLFQVERVMTSLQLPAGSALDVLRRAVEEFDDVISETGADCAWRRKIIARAVAVCGEDTPPAPVMACPDMIAYRCLSADAQTVARDQWAAWHSTVKALGAMRQAQRAERQQQPVQQPQMARRRVR